MHDASTDMDRAVPVDDEFLRKWRPSRNVDKELEDARLRYTSFFHAPGCYQSTTNLNEAIPDMSPVNARIFDVFKETYNKNLEVARDSHGTQKIRTSEYTFFRFALAPVDPDSTAQRQEWAIIPLEKYRPKQVKEIRIQMELLTSPRTPTSSSVVFVRTFDSRVTPAEFLYNQAMAQSFRTKAVAKALTGVKPSSIVHAELLIDAAIERDIIKARMEAQEPLTDFWKLPMEVRGRIYQLAADAQGEIWPLDLHTYHRYHPEILYNKLCGSLERREYASHGSNLIFTNGLILPASLACLMQTYAYEPIVDTDGEVPQADGSDSYRTLSTPALLRTSKGVRAEAIQVLFMQPTFCFSRLTHLHDFVKNTPDDALSSLRKMKLDMALDDLLLVFSVARLQLTSSETEVLKSFLGSHSTLAPAMHLQQWRTARALFPHPCEKLFTENDAVFVERSESMRFTHLTLDVKADPTPESDFSAVQAGMPNTQGHGQLADPERPQQLGRLLLVKLVNLTLDLWAQQSGDRPLLMIRWPADVQADHVEALEIMSKVYPTTEVSDE